MGKRKLTSTECVHSGADRDRESFAITTPIVHSAPFSFKSTQELREFMEGRSGRRQAEYGRLSNPTVCAAERRLAALEGAESAQLFASGMAAVTSLFFTLLQSGDHIILTSDSYFRTREFGYFLTKFGVEIDVVDPSVGAIESAIRPSTRLIFTEVPTNPFLKVVDLETLTALAKKNNILTVIDSTFATPCNLRPLELGADLVTHSATKYLGGHNDLIAGVLVGRAELVQPVAEMLKTLGGICDPNTAFLLERGLKTLSMRVERHNRNGQLVAQFLESHPKVERVFYLGLASHPDHQTAARLMDGFGGVVTFQIAGGIFETSAFIDRLKIPQMAPSLGGVETLIDPVALMSYWDYSRAEREKMGIPDNLVRLALGIEEAEDLIEDLRSSLDSL